jgi:hypothetical protein
MTKREPRGQRCIPSPLRGFSSGLRFALTSGYEQIAVQADFQGGVFVEDQVVS